MAVLSSDNFLILGLSEVRVQPTRSKQVSLRRFAAFYKTSPDTCSRLWSYLSGHDNPRFQPKHLLWGILFLSKYDTEEGNATRVGVDEKTFRKWQWLVVKKLAGLDLVRHFLHLLSISNL